MRGEHEDTARPEQKSSSRMKSPTVRYEAVGGEAARILPQQVGGLRGKVGA